MTMIPAGYSYQAALRRLRAEEMPAVAHEVEQRQAARVLPGRGTLPVARWGRQVELTGAIVLGIVSAAIAGLACFVLFCMLLHVALF